MEDTTDRRPATAPDLHALLDIPRRRATDAPAPFHASRALQQLPAVVYDVDLLWHLGFCSRALRPINLSGGWQ
jgi:hypothetical protein